MKAEIISVGTELILGHVVNTNASYISRSMAEIGIDILYHSAVGDNEERISDSLHRALKRSDIIITTGGLGPTVDDITLAAIAKTINRKLVFNKAIAEKIKDYFRKKHIPFIKASFRQAYIPEGSLWLKNAVGTAPSLIIQCEDGQKFIVCLPGPPREVTTILENELIPYFKKHIKTQGLIKSRLIKLIGLSEVSVDSKIKDILKLERPTTVGIYTNPGEVHIKITAKAGNEKECGENIKKIEKVVRKRLSKFIYGVDNENLEGVVVDLLIKSKNTLGIAESCTGGLVTHRITNISGSSNCFKMGIVAYGNDAKIAHLGVSRALITRYGTVSKLVAIAMAKGIKKAANTKIGIGITGIAGPTGATKTKPVGLVHIALVSDKKKMSKKCFFLGKREDTKFLASQAALELIWMHLKK